MSNETIEPFTRELNGEPTDHQRKFLFLPFPTFRDFTNVRSLFVEDYEKRKGKRPPEFAINKTIQRYHEQLGQLDKWTNWNLDKLDFIWPEKHSERVDAEIWSMSKERQDKVHRKLTDHEKQFAYLPLHILNRATNVRELLSHVAQGIEWKLDYVVREIHKQLASKRGRWVPELYRMRFILSVQSEPTDEPTENAKSMKDQTTTKKQKTTNEKVTSTANTSSTTKHPDPVPSTSKAPPIVRSPKKTDYATKTTESTGRELRKRKSDTKHDEENTKKDGENATEKQANNVPAISKTVQSTLPSWLNSMSKPKIPNLGAEIPNLPKRNKSTTPQRPRHEVIASGINTSVRKLIDAELQDDHDQEEDPSVIIVPSSSPQLNLDAESGEQAARESSKESSKQFEEQLLPVRREFNFEDRIKQRDSYTPSDFQNEILKLSFEDFISKTNIKDVIQREYREKENNANAQLSDAAMHPRLEFYYEYRTRTREWHRNGIKNLKFKECDCKRNVAAQLNLSEESKDAKNKKTNKSSKKNQSSKSSGDLNISVEPSDFQKEIMAMDFETFVNETNIRELIIKDFQKQFEGNREITEEEIAFGLKKYDEFRKRPNKWHHNSLIHLKHKRCECKRTKKFEEKSVGTDKVVVREADTQCCSMDFNTSEITEAEQYQQLEQEHQRLASLSIHTINESQIICMRNCSPTSESIQNEEQRTIQNLDQDSTRITGIDELENVTVLQVTPRSEAETQYSSSQSVTGSGQESSAAVNTTMVQSQQILSVAQVRMSEMIEATEPAECVDIFAVNTLENEPTPADALGDTSVAAEDDMVPSQIISPFQPQENSTQISSTTDEVNGASGSGKQPKIKEELELSYHLDDDSDVICLGDKVEEILEISEDLSEQELFNQVDNNIIPDNFGSLYAVTPPLSQINAPEIRTANDLIDILTGDSPVIEDSESPCHDSPLKNVVNTQPSTSRPSSKQSKTRKRPPSTTKNRRNNNAKKQKVSNDDTLSTIQVPKYTYGPLHFVSRPNSNHEHLEDVGTSNGKLPLSHQTDKSQPSTPNNTDYSIDDSSSTDGTNVTSTISIHINGMISDSCLERANLLNQDNTLFLNVNTQLMNSERSSSSPNPINQEDQTIAANVLDIDVTNTNELANRNANENPNLAQVEDILAVTLPNPGPSTLSAISNEDRTEFLHYIDISKVISSIKIVITESENRGRHLDIETTLQHQCNASNRIVVKGDALKAIMKLTNKEWEAVQATLLSVDTFQFEAKNDEPMDGSILHRALYYLFKTASKISNVHIAYGDHDLETARVFFKSSHSTENVTAAINPFVLSMMKAKVHEPNQ